MEILRAVADDLNPSDYVVVNGERVGVQATIHRALARVQELEAQAAMLTADPEAMAFRYIAAVNRGKQSEAKVQELERLVNEKANIALRLLNENALLKNQVDLIEPMRVRTAELEREVADLQEAKRKHEKNANETIEALEREVAELKKAAHKSMELEDEEEIEICLGCHTPTAERDCGCPAGTAKVRRKVT